MIPRDVIDKILDAGVQAPSGDNSQPWQFAIENDSILVFNIPGLDNPIFNFRQRGSYVAQGAVIENMVVAAGHFGYSAHVEIFPDFARPELTAVVTLAPSVPKEDLLYAAIYERSTNRKKYADTQLTDEQRTAILDTIEEITGVQLFLTENAQQKQILGRAVSMNEVVMLENHELHDYFFGDVRWSEKEEKEKKSGLYVKTMELAPPQKLIFKLLSSWPVAQVLNALGIARFIAKENAKSYSSGAAIGVIVVSNKDQNFVLTGRAMQRVWLKVTTMGLSMHLITGILYLMQGIAAGKKDLSEQHIAVVKNAYADILSTFPIEGEVVSMLFRIGHGGSPSARSSKKAPIIVSAPDTLK